MATLSEILQRKISKDGYSKAYVASELKVGERTIEYYLSGERKPDFDNLLKLSALLGFELNELSEPKVRDNKPEPKQKSPKQISSKESKNDNYVSLLESNDQFFKQEYAQMLLSLRELIGLSKRQEALLKLNLQHVGAVEAFQKGVEADVVQEQINIQIAEMASFGETDNDDDK
jgi:transcriptional regulator with XRE-family HTH domain